MPWKERNVMDLRLEFVLRTFERNVCFKDLCREYGISTKTGYKWKTRFIEEGYNGLADQSRKPHNSPNETSEDIVCEIIRIKLAHRTWGPKKIQTVYSRNHMTEHIPSLSTFDRILDKAGLVTHTKKRKQRTSERIASRIPAEHPNDVWTVDFKGWWYTPEGEKCEPLTVRDEYSKYILAIAYLKKGTTKAVQDVFEQLFREYGLPKVIRSDNGPPFASPNSILGLTKLSAWWVSLGIQPDRIRPGKPQENGSHERMHKDIKGELQGKIPGGIAKHQAVFDIWRNEYNTERPHEALEMKTPSEVYTKSESKYNGTVKEIEYPMGYLSRKVNDRGTIGYNGRRIFITNALYGYTVGLKFSSGIQADVWFDNYRLGEIDLLTNSFSSILSKKRI